MALKENLRTYKARMTEIEKFIDKERRTVSLELRWQQLNSAYAMAKGLGLLQEDASEIGVFETWAKLKAKATNQISRK